MGLVLSNSNFFINKNSQGRKSVREKSTYSRKFGFTNSSGDFVQKILLTEFNLRYFKISPKMLELTDFKNSLPYNQVIPFKGGVTFVVMTRL